MELSEEKTLITHINDGFDFLGVNIKMYKDKPSKKNFKAIVDKIRKVIKENPSMKQEILIRKLNPIITGWVNYQKYNVSSKAFEKLDYEVYKCLWKWCIRRHPKKSRKWIAKKYFHIIGNRTWTFSVATERKIKNGEKYYLCLKYATDTDIRRFTKIQAKANPFDEDWQAYFDKREETTLAL